MDFMISISSANNHSYPFYNVLITTSHPPIARLNKKQGKLIISQRNEFDIKHAFKFQFVMG